MAETTITRGAALRAIRREARTLPADAGGCTLCALVAHGGRSHVLVRRKRVLARLVRYGVRQGHVIVVLRRHVERWEDVAWEDWRDAQRLAWETARALERAFDATRVYVAAFGSAVARPMTFPHQHLHVVPTYHGDRRDRPAAVFTWSDGVVLQDDDEARRLRETLCAAWPSRRAS